MEAEVINQLNNTLNDLEKRSETSRLYGLSGQERPIGRSHQPFRRP